MTGANSVAEFAWKPTRFPSAGFRVEILAFSATENASNRGLLA